MAIKEQEITEISFRPSLSERETIITFNESMEPAEIFTYNKSMIRKMDVLAEQRPDEICCTRADNISGISLRQYTFPKKWFKISPSRNLSDEERKRRAIVGRKNMMKSIFGH